MASRPKRRGNRIKRPDLDTFATFEEGRNRREIAETEIAPGWPEAGWFESYAARAVSVWLV